MALEPAANNIFKARRTGGLYQLCANGVQHKVCNWMVSNDNPDKFCLSCGLNEVIPDLSVPGNLERWHKLEMAKRRLLCTILLLGLPMDGNASCPTLRFRFLSDAGGQETVMSGYLNGVITLNIAEADDAERERRRVNLHEPFRTLLGHLRHEIGHHFWSRLIDNGPRLDAFRQLFGDERNDYGAALQAHYANGAPPDWQTRFVSAYASAHPSEDWAETWANYFHIVDTMESAASFGLRLRPNHPSSASMTADPKAVAKPNAEFDALMENWFPLTYALNSLNRGMGLNDLYPFVLSNPALEKLRFVHDVVRENRVSNAAAVTN